MKAALSKYVSPLILSGLDVFAQIKGVIIVTILTVVADFITGIWASIKLKGIKSIKSYKMGTTVSRLLIYLTAICMSFLVQKYLLDNSFPIVGIISGIVGIKEIYSIIENLNKISGDNTFVELLTKLSSINYKKEEKKGSEEPPK